MPSLSAIAGNCLRRPIRALVRLHYPKIEVSNRERIPSSGPVLLVANHANSLIDPVMVGIAAKRPVRFLAKAPLFQIPVLGPAMRAVGMLPAFRGSDDRAKLKRNLESLGAAATDLVKGDAIGIFPEGLSHDSLKLRMIRSGAARIALQAVTEGADNLQIVPLGLNYQSKERFLSSVWIRVGEPIRIASIVAAHRDDERGALREITKEIEHGLQQVVIHLNDETWERFLYDLEVIFPPPREARRGLTAALRQRQRIASAMNYFIEHDRARVEPLGASIEQFRQRLAVAGLKIDSPMVRSGGWRLLGRMVVATAILPLGIVPVLLGTLHHLVPFAIVRAVSPRFQGAGKTTTSLTRLWLGLPVFVLWYALVWFGMSNYFQPWVAWTWAAAMPFAGIFALNYWGRARAAGLLWFHQLRLLTHRGVLRKFRSQHKALCLQLQTLAEEYRSISPRAVETPSRFPRGLKAKFALGFAGGAALAVAVVLWSAGLWREEPVLQGLSEQRLDLAHLSGPALGAQLNRDEAALTDIIDGIEELESRAFNLREDFLNDRRSYYRQADNDAIRQLLLSYLNYRTALLRIVWKYQDYGDIPDEALRARTMLTGYTAASILYETSLKLVVEFGQTPEAVRKLNEPEPLWEIPSGVFDTVKQNVMNPEARQLMSEAAEKYRSLASMFQKHGLDEPAPYPLFHQAIQDSAAAIERLSPSLPSDGLPPAVGTLTGQAADTIYRGKSIVSLWIGDMRIRSPRAGKSLIRTESLAKLGNLLKPGDILLERRNWYLSNAFLPGYWPHAALYVGTVQDLARLGLDQDPRVRRHWGNFIVRDEEGHEHVIIESIGEGVVFTSLAHSVGGADSAAVLRPIIDERAIAECIARAFSHVGKPYDFDFDFFSTDKLVCTELVFRAYDGELDLPLIDILGRKTMPALEFVRKYSEERGQPGAQLKFIAFLDGDEATGRAEFKKESIFLETLERPALTWLH